MLPNHDHDQEKGTQVQIYLEYHSDKGAKFWRVETAGNEMCVNWGKVGTPGRYQIKEFDSAEACETAARKLAESKTRKGYGEAAFNSEGHLYFAEDEYGLHPLTSHPNYRRFFSDDIYWDEGDEETPFGSDEGSDTYAELAEAMRGKKPVDLEDFPRYIVEDLWEMWFRAPIPGQVAERFDQDLADAQAEDSAGYLLNCDQVIVATVLGAVRITGRVPLELVDLALAALERMELWYQRQDYDPMSTASQIRADLHAYRSWLLSTRAE